MGRARKEIDTKTYCGRLALRLKVLREKSKLTQEDVAEKIGSTKKTVYNWESGISTPPYEMLPKLAEAFGVKVRTVIPEE